MILLPLLVTVATVLELMVSLISMILFLFVLIVTVYVAVIVNNMAVSILGDVMLLLLPSCGTFVRVTVDIDYIPRYHLSVITYYL